MNVEHRFELIKAALAGLCANPELTHHDFDKLAEYAVKHADAVMEKLEPTEEPSDAIQSDERAVSHSADQAPQG